MAPNVPPPTSVQATYFLSNHNPGTHHYLSNMIPVENFFMFNQEVTTVETAYQGGKYWIHVPINKAQLTFARRDPKGIEKYCSVSEEGLLLKDLLKERNAFTDAWNEFRVPFMKQLVLAKFCLDARA